MACARFARVPRSADFGHDWMRVQLVKEKSMALAGPYWMKRSGTSRVVLSTALDEPREGVGS